MPSRILVVNVGNYSDVPTRNLRMTTLSPGGCGELSWEHETQPPYLGVLDLLENERVEVFDGQGLVWRGRLEARRPQLQFGTGLWRITALGFAASLRDQFYTSAKTYAGGATIESIFTDTRTQLCPDIAGTDAAGAIVATERTLSGVTADLIGKNAQDVYDQATVFGTSGNARLYWHIWEGTAGAANKATLELIARPGAYGYVVSLSHGAIVDLEWSLSRLYNRIVVKWGPTATPTYTTRNDTVSQGARPAGYGVIRSKLVSHAAVNSATDAQNVGDVLLQQYGSIRAFATSIQIPETALVEDAAGSRVEPWRMKAGNILRIRELKAGASATREYEFFVAQTTWDEERRVLTCTPEGVEDLTAQLARYLRAERLT